MTKRGDATVERVHKTTSTPAVNDHCRICASFQTRESINWEAANLLKESKAHQYPRHVIESSAAIVQHALQTNFSNELSCTFCGFISRGVNPKRNLQEHMKTHTGEKPFICTYCPYKSLKRGNLNRHLLLQHGVAEPRL